MKFFLILLVFASAVFSQEAEQPASGEAIKFQIPLDESGLPPPPPPLPQKPDTVQKLGLPSNAPLNLAALSAKDTAGFETYSRRHALVQDSISAAYRQMEAVKKNSESFMQPLEPKGEFEKQADYDARKNKWSNELAQRIERDTKSISVRLSELEKAKTKIQENQASLYGSVEIKSNPSAASIWVGREEVGASPAEYKLLIPGSVKIRLQKEGYNAWDTTLQVAPGQKFKLGVTLDEKSIFSQENEINFSQVLSKDTTIQGYLARIEKVKARKAETDDEIKQILSSFSSTYQPLEPQKPDESPEAFAKRHEAWTKEGMRQFTELQRKHEAYSKKLERSIEVLNDHVIGIQSALAGLASPAAQIQLGAYDAEKETFELAAEDTSSQQAPFRFSGKVGVPLAAAKTLDRSAPGFTAGVQFINYPFATEDGSVNLAMSRLQISMGVQALNVEGSFGEIERYKSADGYGAWKLRADSLLSGSLKPRNLDYAYAMGREAAKDAKAKGESDGDGGMGWRGWTRIAAFTAAAACGGVAIFKNSGANKSLKDIDNLKKNPPQPGAEEERWKNQYNSAKKQAEDREFQRSMYSAAAGALAIAGALTFVF